HFKPEKQGIQKRPLSSEYIRYLSKVLEYNYSEVNDLSHESYHIRTCRKNQSYSSFNMGAGEDAIMILLSYIQSMPDNSLCIIEEIELGIHPAALSKLAEVIQEIALNKKMQFIISSHSRDFIDNLPRCARILLQRFEDHCHVFNDPTTRYAISTMSVRPEAELYIYCEDDLAKRIILKSLSNNTRRRVEIIEIGSKSAFIKMLEYHRKAMPKMKSLFVWDGDVSDGEAKSQFNNDLKPNYFFLHPSESPEYNILISLKNSGVDLLKQKLNFESNQEVSDLLDSLLTLEDLHSFPYEVSCKTMLSEDEIIGIFIDCYKVVNGADFNKIETLIKDTLDLPPDNTLQNHNR
ncbi:MAG: AAA family ATPase, partial [Clostridia bacterium]|nr:AAA family ATPase [Clostridia bacterium]